MSHDIIERTLRIFRANSDFCVFDLETTGKSATPGRDGEPGSKVLQLAARRYRYDHKTRTARLLAEMNVLINDPTITEIDPYLTENVHHISIEMIREPAEAAKYGATIDDPESTWKRFAKMLSGAVAMGQNINSFDIPFAQVDAARWGVKLPFRTADGKALPVGFDPKTAELKTIDTLHIARLLWHFDNRGQGKAGYKLRSLASFLKVKTDPALDHNALGDIDTTWQVFMAMLPHLRSYSQRFMSPSGPDQYRRLLPPLRSHIPTPAEHAAAKAALEDLERSAAIAAAPAPATRSADA